MVEWGEAFMQCDNIAVRLGGREVMTGPEGGTRPINIEATVQVGGVWMLLDVFHHGFFPVHWVPSVHICV